MQIEMRGGGADPFISTSNFTVPFIPNVLQDHTEWVPITKGLSLKSVIRASVTLHTEFYHNFWRNVGSHPQRNGIGV